MSIPSLTSKKIEGFCKSLDAGEPTLYILIVTGENYVP